MHPERLAPHPTEIYSHDKVFKTNKDFAWTHAYFHTTDEGFPIGMHSHSFYEVNVIVAGEGYHYIEQQCLAVNKGDVFVLPPSIRHGYYTDDPDFKIFHILLNCLFIERYKKELRALPGYTTLFETEPYLRTVSTEKLLLHLDGKQFAKIRGDIEELLEFADSDYEGNEIQKNTKVLCIIAYLSRLIWSAHHAPIHTSPYRTESLSVMRTMEYIQSNYSDKISVEKLAEIAHMSKSSFLRHFRKVCNCTPQKYVTEIRVQKAAELLKTTNRSVTEIAHDCGFFDGSHFTHIFCLLTGCSPSHYRREHAE